MGAWKCVELRPESRDREVPLVHLWSYSHTCIYGKKSPFCKFKHRSGLPKETWRMNKLGLQILHEIRSSDTQNFLEILCVSNARK